MKLTTIQKRKILARYTECLVNEGVAIDFIFATPLSHFNYQVIINEIHRIEIELMEMDESELFTLH